MYFKNISVALSQLWNTTMGGMPDETICSRAWRLHIAGKSEVATAFVHVVNALFFWQSNHCRGSYQAELDRKHSPQELVTGK